MAALFPWCSHSLEKLKDERETDVTLKPAVQKAKQREVENSWVVSQKGQDG